MDIDANFSLTFAGKYENALFIFIKFIINYFITLKKLAYRFMLLLQKKERKFKTETNCNTSLKFKGS